MTTPCVNFCWIDPSHGLCEGCGRTREEVAQWAFLGEEKRRALMPELKQRVADLKRGDLPLADGASHARTQKDEAVS